jgi:hypothetical protein
VDAADRIWNRACNPTARLERSGDRALQAAILIHGLVMNSGLYPAMYGLTFDELMAAADGFEYLGSTDVAGVVRTAVQEVFPEGPIDDGELRETHVDEYVDGQPDRLDQLEAAYHDLLPGDDAALVAAFRRRLTASPDDFAAP